jgi:hypothetical protein
MEAKVAVLKVGRFDLPEPRRPSIGHDNLVKRQFLPLFDLLPTVKRFNWHGLRHFAVSRWIDAGLAQDGTDFRGPRVAASYDGSLGPSGPHCQGVILIHAERLTNVHVPSMCHERAGRR